MQSSRSMANTSVLAVIISSAVFSLKLITASIMSFSFELIIPCSFPTSTIDFISSTVILLSTFKVFIPIILSINFVDLESKKTNGFKIK